MAESAEDPIPKEEAKHRHFSLVVYHRNGVQVVPLEAGQAVVVGRSAPADCIVPESELSRRHAKFEIARDEVWVHDLESTNGTWVDDKRIESSVLEPGKTVRLGSVIVAVHTFEQAASPFHRLSGHDQFLSILDEEVFRAKAFKRTVAVVMVRGFGDLHHISQWFQGIRKLLRPIDRAAMYAPDTLEISLPEAGLSEALRLANAMVRGRDNQDAVLGCGVAIFPDSGTTSEQLIDQAKTAIQETTPEAPIRVAAPQSTRWPEPSSDLSPPVIFSPAMRQIYETVDRLARTAVPVLIHGETGTGKELVARAIHDRGARSNERICCVNCGAIPNQLVESILFGHERGAFSGADRATKGVFEEADGGTVLLDEIGELPLSAQAALLRVLETKRITRVGSNKEIELDVRIITATHCDLEAMCREGRFRHDVWFRLNTVVLELPPLRDRREEIPALVERFIEQSKSTTVESIDDDALELLENYHWPGNIRELRNVVERAVVLAVGNTITVNDLPQRVRDEMTEGTVTHMELPPHGSKRIHAVDEEDGSRGDGDFKSRVQRFETQLIRSALEESGGNQTRAAKRLGIPLRSLVRKIKTYGLD
jgi:two-component system, NtrC family, response regulator AtoC